MPMLFAGDDDVGGEADGGFCAPASSGNMTAMESVRELLIAATFFRFDTLLFAALKRRGYWQICQSCGAGSLF